jgi:hypothetical protein
VKTQPGYPTTGKCGSHQGRHSPQRNTDPKRRPFDHYRPSIYCAKPRRAKPRGQDLIEYALMAGFVAVAAAALTAPTSKDDSASLRYLAGRQIMTLMGKACPDCRTVNRDDATQCDACGARLSPTTSGKRAAYLTISFVAVVAGALVMYLRNC